MTLTRSGGVSNQAKKLAAALNSAGMDMPALGKDLSQPSTTTNTGPNTRNKRLLPQPAPAMAVQPAAKAPKLGPSSTARLQPRPISGIPTILGMAGVATPSLPASPFRHQQQQQQLVQPQATPTTTTKSTSTPRSTNTGRNNLAANVNGGGGTPTSNSKAEKGLRHFSAKVCAKVEEKGSTSYNEVADELVQEMGSELGFDSKNIRRRVYDALNVLMAIDVIEKDRKEIRWLGLSNETTNELSAIESELGSTLKRVEEKQRTLRDLVQRKIALHSLINRNSRSQNSINAQTLSSTSLLSDSNIDGSRADRLYLPFILINAPRDCRVHCEMLEDRTQYFFEFDMSFFINEDIELLRLMGLDSSTPDELRTILTPEVYSYYMSKLKSGLTVPSCATFNDLASSTNHHNHSFTSTSTIRRSSYNPPPSSPTAHSMTSPIRPRRTNTNPVAGSTLRNQISASNLTSDFPQSPKPIGHTGIFRRTPKSSQQSTPKHQTTKQLPPSQAKNIPADPFGFNDDISRFGLSFSDSLGPQDHHHQGRSL